MNGGNRSSTVWRLGVSLGLYSAVLSAGGAILFRVVVFPLPDEWFEVVRRSAGIAGVLAVGGLLAGAVSTYASYRLEAAYSRSERRLNGDLTVGLVGPLAAAPVGFILLGATMGWAGLWLLLALVVAASAGFVGISRLVR